nr:hypothetical protein [Coxiella-like endosymbiont]
MDLSLIGSEWFLMWQSNQHNNA